ncbi:MAG: transposase, partial [Patescibacteria group bacterium]
MPAKNTIKVYADNSFYHIYNRGVNKQEIFVDSYDYYYFLYLLKKYLDPTFKKKFIDPVTGEALFVEGASFVGDVKLVAFALMPNHYHLLLHNISKYGMEKLLRRVGTSYSLYFNNKYDRVGGVFQGVYKGVMITNQEHLLHLSCYIHLNPTELSDIHAKNLTGYDYSSYKYFLGEREGKWLHPNILLDMFYPNEEKAGACYAKFVENHVKRFLEIRERVKSV